MVTIDIIGLLATVFLVGIRYPHYVLVGTCIYEFGHVFITLLLHGHIRYIVAAGVFGTMAVGDDHSNIIEKIIILSGPLANYVTCVVAGGIVFEPTGNLLNPLANLRSPFAVVNFRLCILSLLIQTWKIFI